jgi:hypothetical protein
MQVPVIETPWNTTFPDLPNWSENYCLAGYDPKCGVGMWLHMGRWRKDLTMWRELVVLRLPDGRVVAHKAIGNARAAEDGPGGPHYAIRIIEPGHKLSYSFHGGARVLPAAEMRPGLVGQGPCEPVHFELTFESNGDIWDLQKVGSRQEFLPAGHIEQIGRLTGTISVGDQTYTFDALANRDHSLGARDNRKLSSHQWHQGYFENGIGFLLFDAVHRGETEPVFSEAVVFEGDKLYEAKLAIDWRCDDVAKDTKPFGFDLTYEKGTLRVDAVSFPDQSYLCFTAPNDMYMGVYQAGDPPLTLLEQSVILKLNGEVPGYGCFERTVPGVEHIED